MKKIITGIIFLGFVIICSLSFSFNILVIRGYIEASKWGGYYFSNLNLIRCKEPFICFHEIAHLLDENLDYPSKSEEFKTDIDAFIVWCKENEPDDYYCSIKDFPGVNGNSLDENGYGGYSEVYAHLFALWHGSEALNYPGVGYGGIVESDIYMTDFIREYYR